MTSKNIWKIKLVSKVSEGSRKSFTLKLTSKLELIPVSQEEKYAEDKLVFLSRLKRTSLVHSFAAKIASLKLDEKGLVWKEENYEDLVKKKIQSSDLYLSEFPTLSYSTTILEQRVTEGFDIGW